MDRSRRSRWPEYAVTRWLKEYKFKDWKTHRTHAPGTPVTDLEREARAESVAKELCDHKKWLTHGRSIKIRDFEEMRLEIDDYSKQPDLADAIRRYYTLLQMTFATTTMYKLFETVDSQIYRFLAQGIGNLVPGTPPGAPVADMAAVVDVACPKCSAQSKVQVNLGSVQPLLAGHLPFPADSKFKCPSCALEIDLSAIKAQLEAQTKKRVAA